MQAKSKNIKKNTLENEKIKLVDYNDLFSDDYYPIYEVPIEELHSFKDHPFRVDTGNAIEELVESIKARGLLVPAIVRPRNEGGYEIISGHRRALACRMSGLTSMVVIVMDIDDNDATIIMVDSNIHREKLSYREKAYAYKMKFEAMKHQGCPGRITTQHVGEETGESGRQVQRYIRLTYLIKLLLDMVDEKKLSFIAAVNLSYLYETEQELVYKEINNGGKVPSIVQAKKLKEFSDLGELTSEVIHNMLTQDKGDHYKITLNTEKINKYFSDTYTKEEVEKVIYDLLEQWVSNQKAL